jgi:tetratricopeptide (TPR) repeat protein
MGSEKDELIRGKEFFKQRKWVDAEVLFRRVLESASANSMRAEAAASLGMTRLAMGDLEDAERRFRTSLDFGGNADAYYGLGVIASMQKQRAAAIEHLREALVINPNHEGAKRELRALAQNENISIEHGRVATDQPTEKRRNAFRQILSADPTVHGRDALRTIDDLDFEWVPRFSAFPISLILLVLGFLVPVILLILLVSDVKLFR